MNLKLVNCVFKIGLDLIKGIELSSIPDMPYNTVHLIYESS